MYRLQFKKILDNESLATISREMARETIPARFTLSYLGVSARVLKNWEDMGVLPDKDRPTRKHSFTFTELIWLFLVRELRDFGLPLKMISRARDQLLEQVDYTEYTVDEDVENTMAFLTVFNDFTPEDDKKLRQYLKDSQGELPDLPSFDTRKMSALHVMLMEALTGEVSFRIMVDKYGNVMEFSDILTDRYAREMLAWGSCIVIPLNNALRMFFQDTRSMDFLKVSGLLTQEEIAILELVRKGDITEATIKFRDGKPAQLSFAQEIRVQSSARIAEILARGAYQTLQITTQSGKISISKLTTKKKLDDKK